jgi:hypothetical protein
VSQRAGNEVVLYSQQCDDATVGDCHIISVHVPEFV